MGVKEVVIEEEDESEETRKPQVARVPRTPTKQEIADHMSHHAEFRDWCPFCVAGKGISRHHQVMKDEPDKIGVTVSMDYAYMNSELNVESGPPTLVAHDSSTGAIWAMLRESKESSEDLVNWMCQNLKDAGYAGVRLTLKSDGEPAMVALKTKMAVKRSCETSIIDSPVRESKSNGAMESSIRAWKGQMRTMRLYLEHRLKKKIPLGHPLLDWLTVWAAELLTNIELGMAGRPMN